jgi:hypothetical protein
MSAPDPNRDLLISYTTLRKIVGILGIALPIVLLFGSMLFSECEGPQRSISHTYHTRMGDVFVGFLCAIALFLFVYRGPEAIDGILGNVAGVLGILVALIPCTPRPGAGGFDNCIINRGLAADYGLGDAHNIIAGLFLLVLAYFSIALFTKTRQGEQPTPEKRLRNTIYRICGWIIVICVIACAIVMFITKGKDPEPEWMSLKPIFWLETAALWAFGFSWLVKGETLWRDR